MSAYTDADVALVANYVPLGFTERDPYRDVDEAARAILDAVAPAIAARALRDYADSLEREVSEESELSWTRVMYEAAANQMRTRAEQIERT